ncbi:MAG: hypothetical protein JWP74_3641 [Marmoricola sp.]|nr:hypothetical protein [Marmoricola sp.]
MTTKRFSVAVLGAVFLVLGISGGAFADYAAATMNLTVTPTTLVGGNTFTGIATSNEDCHWSITYGGPASTAQPITGTGTSLHFSFNTDTVGAVRTDAVTAVCSYDPSVPRATVTQTLQRSVDVTLTPTGVSPPTTSTGGGLGLPNTGGPSLWLAVAGLALTLLGAGAVVRSRARA